MIILMNVSFIENEIKINVRMIDNGNDKVYCFLNGNDISLRGCFK